MGESADTAEARVDELLELFMTHGGSSYDEAVSMTEHGIQAAERARTAGAPDHLVVAALVHDVGHFLLARSRGHEDFLEHDWDHERAGAGWLRPVFGDEVAEPVALHVDAKRWLCHREPEYLASLSPASVASLAVQGGPFDEREAVRFESRPFAAEAVRVRRWDDAAKVPGHVVPPLESFRTLLLERARAGASPSH